MPDLDARKQTILQAIIIEYVTAAEPIGSEALVQKYQLGVKSATVRNEMAEMSDLGFLEQPHTSAGRIPSDMGYRYYVDHLIVRHDVDEATRSRVRNAASDGDALQGLLRDTIRALSRVTHLLGAATIVRDSHVTIRTAVVSALGPTKALLVLVLSNGHVENRMIDVPVGLTLDDVGYANDLLANAVVGKQLRILARTKTPTGFGNVASEKLAVTLWSNLRSIARQLTRGVVITEGEEFMFGQPEFQRDLVALHSLLEELTDSDVLYDTLAPTDDVRQVTIGRENRHERMRQLSVVRKSFHIGGEEAGVIALVGPTRMNYDRSIPLVNYTAKALGDSLSRFFG
ncbi:MAG: heat-inducible transcriptional repressor HrcA [Fimbriimonas sp.]|nr:heat-inducible transcriptional repressor HrcA [Fimbriimonas sp.]